MSPRLSVVALALGLAMGACGGGGGSAPPAVPLPAGGVPAGWALVWSDEFDQDGLPDPAKWVDDTEHNASGWFNNELQYYAARRPENARVEGGRLVITARRERLADQADYGGQDYSSARLMTRGRADWTHGFFEIRARLPCGLGTWPAIWMLGSRGHWPDDGEIDIMEQAGAQPGRILGTVHMRDFHGGSGIGDSHTVADPCGSFHDYQMLWTAEAIVWGIDGVSVHQYRKPAGAGYGTWPFDFPQYLLLNLAVGGTLGGPPDAQVFPAQMEVEHVRVYQAGPG